MQRILIIGCSGSGKTTLAHRLAQQTGLPSIHLDEAYFSPDWVEPKPEDWAKTVQDLVARDRWVMDGNFSGTFAYRMPRADTVIFLDQPTWRCLWRVIWRTIKFYGEVRPGSAPGCRERFDLPFLSYVLHYNATRRPGILRVLNEQRALGKAVYHLRSTEEVAVFLAGVGG
ncbi:MAG: AAA family ATPase [Bacteroidota bacterium]